MRERDAKSITTCTGRILCVLQKHKPDKADFSLHSVWRWEQEGILRSSAPRRRRLSKMAAAMDRNRHLAAVTPRGGVRLEATHDRDPRVSPSGARACKHPRHLPPSPRPGRRSLHRRHVNETRQCKHASDSTGQCGAPILAACITHDHDLSRGREGGHKDGRCGCERGGRGRWPGKEQ